MATLLLKYQAAVIREIPLDKPSMTIGRKPDNDIVIDNMAVSGHHAKCALQGSAYIIEDLKSTNGTFLNGKRILTASLKHNDQIGIAQHTIVFQDPTSTRETSPAEGAPKTATTGPATRAGTNELVGAPPDVSATLRLLEGKADQPAYALTDLLTRIGKSEAAAIRLRGMFAPDIAALISKRPAGYILTAIKDGYPKVNAVNIYGQVPLADGDVIEVGGLRFIFQIKEGV